jgi:hypothetical protein
MNYCCLNTTDVDTLCITDIDLDPSPHDLEIPNLAFVNTLSFEDMHDSRIMDQIIQLLYCPFYMSFKFTCCTFGSIADAFRPFNPPGSGGLDLKKINHNIAPLLRCWNGNSLDITDCPGFNDNILDMMGSKENGTFLYAPYLQTLSIYSPPNFSVAALRRFVESRLDLPVDVEQSDPVTTRIHNIYLFSNALPVSREDKGWFVANLTGFCWY